MNNHTVIIIFLSVLSTSFVNIQAGWDDLILTTDKFSNCPRSIPFPNRLTKILIQKNGVDHGVIINAVINITEEVSYGCNISFEITKCLLSKDDNSCSLYRKFYAELCSSFFNPTLGITWYQEIPNFGPCPIKPGTYPVTGMLFDFNVMGPWRVLPYPEQYIGHWKVDVKAFKNDKLTSCIAMEGDVKKKRRSSKKIARSQ